MSINALVPSVRSRLWASGISFVLGFALANYGILMVVRPDQFLWLGAAAVLMLTGAAGILFADTSRAVSFWAVLEFSFTYSVLLLSTNRPVSGSRLLLTTCVLSKVNVEPVPTLTDCGSCVSGATAVVPPCVNTLTGSMIRPAG